MIKRFKNNIYVEKAIDFLLNILIIIFGIVLLVSIYTGLQTRVLGQKYANFFGYSSFEVQTGSMADSINAGDWIIVKLTDDVKLKDVITYELEGQYITHRIIEVYKNKYVTQGDANSAKDKPIDKDQVVGKVVKVLPNFGILRKVLFNPAVLISFMVTLLLFNMAIKKNKTEIKKSNKEKVFSSLVRKIGWVFTRIKNLINRKKIVEENINAVANRIATVEETVEEEPIIDEVKEAELEKTMLYRVIPVDATEIDETFLEIAENELKEASQAEKLKARMEKEQQQEEVVVEEDDSLTKINLELLKEKKGIKKTKNIIDTVMLLKREELYEILDIFLGDAQKRPGVSTVRNNFVNTYIESKYYNYYSELSNGNSGKNIAKKLERVIMKLASTSIDKYRGKNNKYGDIVDMHVNALTLIAHLENARDSISDFKAKEEFYKKEIAKRYKDLDEQRIQEIVDGITKIQKNYIDMIGYFLKKFDTNMFTLNFNKLSSKRDMYALQLEHNIVFSRVYSDYIIDKTYNEGIIAEDKMVVLLNLLSVQLVSDMQTFNFDKKYILYIPKSLYTKSYKLDRVLKTIDDSYAKENVIILVTFDELIKNRKHIKEVRKTGYRFAILFDKEPVVNDKTKANIYIADYIFVDKKKINMEVMASFIPEELLNNVIYEDLIEKIGDFGSE